MFSQPLEPQERSCRGTAKSLNTPLGLVIRRLRRQSLLSPVGIVQVATVAWKMILGMRVESFSA